MVAGQKLIFRALARFVPGLIIISGILFLSAGSVSYWNAWLFLAVLFVPMSFVIVYLIFRDPELLDKRLNTREKESNQKGVILSTLVTLLAGFVLSGLDYRFGWSQMPAWLVFCSALIFLTGYILFFFVMRQNSFASRVVEIQEKQKVIDTGLYSLVRHPMYFAAVLMFLFMPLVLGSYYSIIPMLFFPFQMIIRIKNEEEVLEEGLDGYAEYKKKVKYKIVPFIW